MQLQKPIAVVQPEFLAESNKGDMGAWTTQQAGTESDVTDPRFHSETAAEPQHSSIKYKYYRYSNHAT